MPSTNDFTPNDVWGSSTPVGTEEELTTPLGQTCRAKKMSIEAMIASGLLTDADSLTAVMAKHTKKVKVGTGPGRPPEAHTSVDEASLMADSKAVGTLFTLVDKAMPHILVSPVVKLHYTTRKVGKTTVTQAIPPEDREKGVVYTDQIAFEDKLWLFDWAAGGLGAMLQFRQ